MNNALEIVNPSTVYYLHILGIMDSVKCISVTNIHVNSDIGGLKHNGVALDISDCVSKVQFIYSKSNHLIKERIYLSLFVFPNIVYICCFKTTTNCTDLLNDLDCCN